MKGFITLTDLIDGSPFTVAIHAIGLISPIEGTNNTGITLSFGSSGKQNYTVNESYEQVLKLIEGAQKPD